MSIKDIIFDLVLLKVGHKRIYLLSNIFNGPEDTIKNQQLFHYNTFPGHRYISMYLLPLILATDCSATSLTYVKFNLFCILSLNLCSQIGLCYDSWLLAVRAMFNKQYLKTTISFKRFVVYISLEVGV